jgi:hypothetical protein
VCHSPPWVLGLVGFPALLLAGQWLRARRMPTRLRATGPVAYALNLAVFLALYVLEATSDAALIFYGASMWLAALRGMPVVRCWPSPTGCLAATTRSAAPSFGLSTSWSAIEPFTARWSDAWPAAGMGAW